MTGYYSHDYFVSEYFPGRYFPPLEDAEAGAASIVAHDTSGGATLAQWFPHPRLPVEPEPERINDGQAIALAILLLAS